MFSGIAEWFWGHSAVLRNDFESLWRLGAFSFGIFAQNLEIFGLAALGCNFDHKTAYLCNFRFKNAKFTIENLASKKNCGEETETAE